MKLCEEFQQNTPCYNIVHLFYKYKFILNLFVYQVYKKFIIFFNDD